MKLKDYHNLRVISDTSKEYPMYFQVTINHEPHFYIKSEIGFGRRKASEVPDDYKTAASSVARTRLAIADIVKCNEFDLFATFTFDKAKHNRQDPDECRRSMSKFLNNSKYRHSPKLSYLVVPEFHKDGKSLHFHALLKNYNGRLKNSGVVQNGREVYNVSGWLGGFSTAVKIDNHEAVSAYIRKYITKDMPTFFARRRYFCSHGLTRPVKSVNKWISLKRIILEYATPYRQDDYSSSYIFPKCNDVVFPAPPPPPVPLTNQQSLIYPNPDTNLHIIK